MYACYAGNDCVELMIAMMPLKIQQGQIQKVYMCVEGVGGEGVDAFKRAISP